MEITAPQLPRYSSQKGLTCPCGSPAHSRGLCRRCYDRLYWQPVARERWRQRNWPRPCGVNEAETLALSEYHSRGYSVVLMPSHAPCDFIVNDHRVDVKGSTVHACDTQARFHLPADCPQEKSPRVSRLLTERCDLVHAIILSDPPQHFIVPAEAIGNERRLFAIRGDGTSRSMWYPYRDRWDLISQGVSA